MLGDALADQEPGLTSFAELALAARVGEGSDADNVTDLDAVLDLGTGAHDATDHLVTAHTTRHDRRELPKLAAEHRGVGATDTTVLDGD